jgi:hypothetical protein
VSGRVKINTPSFERGRRISRFTTEFSEHDEYIFKNMGALGTQCPSTHLICLTVGLGLLATCLIAK